MIAMLAPKTIVPHQLAVFSHPSTVMMVMTAPMTPATHRVAVFTLQ
jgi:hypothetical protein